MGDDQNEDEEEHAPLRHKGLSQQALSGAPKHSQLASQPAEPTQTVPRAKKWHRRWVLIPNVLHFGEDIWIQKWFSSDQLKDMEIERKKRDEQLVREREKREREKEKREKGE